MATGRVAHRRARWAEGLDSYCVVVAEKYNINTNFSGLRIFQVSFTR